MGIGFGWLKKLAGGLGSGLRTVGSIAIEHRAILTLAIPGLGQYGIAFSGANAIIDYFDDKEDMTNDEKQLEAATGLAHLIKSTSGRWIDPETPLRAIDDIVALKRAEEQL